jgi:MFS family permease
LLALAGFGMMVQMATSNTSLQTMVDEDKRRRVMGLYALALLGVTPLGSLLGDVLAGWAGVTATVLAVVDCLVGAAVFAYQLPRLRAAVHPIYAGMGIVPEIAKGMKAASEAIRPSKG